VLWSTPTSPKFPSRPPAAYPSSAITAVPKTAATSSFAKAAGSGSGRRAHCWPSTTADAAAATRRTTQIGPSGGVGVAASTGSAGMSPPKTVNALNVATPA
jgi:hypothetical protein